MRVFTFRRTLVQTRARGHSARRGVAYRLGLAAESAFADRKGRTACDYSRRRGIGEAGCALPADASMKWTDPLYWSGEIERVDRRKNSRQFRDDVVAIPREAVLAGQSEGILAVYAQKIAKRRNTPVHWVMHDADGENPHGHVMYAGRQLDGDEFAKNRDRDQDAKSDPRRGVLSLADVHSQLWIETLRLYGYEASYEPIAENGIAQEHIGPRPWAREKKAIESELAETIADALDSPIDAGDALKAACAVTADLIVTDALALDRDPVTPQMIEARKPIRATAPAVALDRPQGIGSPAPDHERPTPAPVPAVAVQRPQGAAAPVPDHDLAVTPFAAVALDRPQGIASPAPEHAHATPAPVPAVAVQRPQGAAAPVPDHDLAVTPFAAVALDRPQGIASPAPEHPHPTPAPAPTVAVLRPRPAVGPIPEHHVPATPSPRRAVPVLMQRPEPTAAPGPAHEASATPGPHPAVAVQRPEPTAASRVRLPVPKHIQEARRVKDAEAFEAEQKKQREKAARSRLHTAITIDTTEAVAEAIIENHAGHAGRHPSFVGDGIGTKASAAAVRALRPHVKPHQVPERHRRMNARTDRQYLDAVKQAISNFRRWFRGRRFFGGDPPAERIVQELRDVAEPVHLNETEEEHRRITEKIAADRERERRRQEQRTRQRYRPQLVQTTPSHQRKPGDDSGHGQGGGYER